MLWQYLAVAALVGAAVYYLARHLKRSLDPKAASTCACGCSEGCRQPPREKRSGPQPPSGLNHSACSTCSIQDRPKT
jgi:hypothetical protein